MYCKIYHVIAIELVTLYDKEVTQSTLIFDSQFYTTIILLILIKMHRITGSVDNQKSNIIASNSSTCKNCTQTSTKTMTKTMTAYRCLC